MAAPAGAAVVTTDHFVSHVSTVPANAGETVGLHLREKSLAPSAARPVVLFVHGAFLPSTVAFDLDYRDYSWLGALARAGFDAFAMTHTGYGASPRPMMDDPCNVDPAQQGLIVPHALAAPCAPRYPFQLVSSRSEWDEIGAVVRYIRELRGVERVNLVGWSAGGPRAGGYAALHPEHVERLVLFAPTPFLFPDDAPPVLPAPGAPVSVQTKSDLLEKRWGGDVRCEGQVDDATVPDRVWQAVLREDAVGARWRPEGVMRAPTRVNYGWRRNAAAIRAPTLMVVGEFDNFGQRREAWSALRAERRVFIKVRCGSHFMQFERGRHLLHRASIEWLKAGTVDGNSNAELQADESGQLDRLA